MKGRFLLLLLLACATCAHAQSQALDPPMSRDEQKSMEQMQRQYRKEGLPPMTDAEVTELVRQIRAKRLQMTANVMALQQAAAMSQFTPSVGGVGGLASPQPQMAAATSALPAMDQAALTAAITLQNAAAGYVHFEQQREGFSHDGKAMVDVEGSITDFGANSATGAVCYRVNTGLGRSLLKFRNVRSDLPPLLLGQILEQGDTVQFQTVTGTTITGDGVIPTSEGAIIVRGGSMVSFDAAQGAQATALPAGYLVANLQHGDIGATGYLLLERDTDDEDNSANQSPLQRLKQAAGGLKAAIGRGSSDYALFKPATGQLIALNVSATGNKVAYMSNCQRQNALVNKCSNRQLRDSLWDTDGQPNDRHYFWSVDWFNTVHGPLAVARENGTSDITVIRLDSGEKVTAFHRGLGIGYWSVERTENGSARLRASWPFNKRPVIDDIGSVFDADFSTVR